MGSSHGASGNLLASNCLRSAAGVGPTGLGDTGAVQVPGVIHHDREVLVIVNRAGNVVVVFDEFILGNNVIGGTVSTETVVELERFQKFLEDLVLGLLTGHNIGVLACRVDALDVIDVNVAVAVLVHLGEATHNDILSCGVHGAADGTDKLVIFNEPAVVEIEGTEKSGDLTFAEAEHVVGHSLGEFVLVKGHRVVVVHDFELTAEANNATSATRSKLLAELINEIVGAGLGSF